MKRVFILLVMLCGLNVAFAQKDVTTFLGIPVDGYKSEMKEKLIKKGFVLKNAGTQYEHLEGEFNGTDVHIYIATKNNKVWRLMVCDANTMSEASIKIRFNNLVRQFEKNKRYKSSMLLNSDGQTIGEDVEINYEMTVHNKYFDAEFYQSLDENKVDTLGYARLLREKLLEKYTEEQLENPTEDIAKKIAYETLVFGFEVLTKKHVWFRISKLHYNEFCITMYYDNEYNNTDGDDL